MIFPIWQELGQSSHLLAQEVGQELGEKATHTGTLDPLAEGVLVVLTGDDCLAKSSFPEWKKNYHFSLLWGIQTDSADQLGVVQKFERSIPSLESIQKVLAAFPASYDQQLPSYSARRWQGKSSFEWAKEGVEIPLKTRTIEVSPLPFLGSQLIATPEVRAQHQESIARVSGEFRQAEVLHSWNESLQGSARDFLITEHRVTLSAGGYVRQLGQDLAKSVGFPVTTWSITREQNGPYTREDC